MVLPPCEQDLFAVEYFFICSDTRQYGSQELMNILKLILNQIQFAKISMTTKSMLPGK